jgi:uncharacterized MAPEG superfamily protein
MNGSGGPRNQRAFVLQPRGNSNGTAYYYVGLSVVLSVLLWIPDILARMVVWGIATFLNNYPAGFPVKQPEQPLWAERSQRAHLNMVETLPAFIGVVLAAGFLAGDK